MNTGKRKKIKESNSGALSARKYQEIMQLFAVNSSSYSLIFFDENGDVIFCNKGAEKISGYKFQELEGSSMLQLYDISSRLIIEDFIHSAAEAKSFNGEFRRRHKNGSFFFLRITIDSVFNEDGKLIGFLETSFDITEYFRKTENIETVGSGFDNVGSTPHYWFWEINANCICTYCSYSVTNLLGYSPGEIVGKNPFDFIIEEDKDKTVSEFLRIMSDKGPIINLENYNRCKDGSIIVLETNGVPFFNSSGQFMGYRGINRDISSIKKAEDKFKEEHNRLRTLINTIPDLIWLKDPEGIYLFCNTRFERFFGAKEAEIIGKSDYDFIPKELADFFISKDKEAVKKGKSSLNLEWVTFNDDGHRELLETIKTPMYDSKGKLTGILGIARDFTAYKKAEEALKESRSKLVMAMDIAGLTNWEIDINTKILTFDDRFYSLYGISDKEYGNSMSLEVFDRNFVHPDDRAKVIEEIRKAIDNNEVTNKSYQVDHRIIRADGEVRYIVMRFIGIRDDEGNLIKTIGINQDITNLKKAEIELRELNASKDKFFSIIAHELRNPFSTIIGFSEILKDEIEYGDKEAIWKYASLINDSAIQTLRLLENLLEWANIQRGNTVYNPKPEKLVDIFNEELYVLNDFASGKNIKLICNIPGNIVLNADRYMVKAIFRNLVSNAIKFTNKNGKIEINIVKKENEFIISVSDNGIGMKPEIIDKLFRIDVSVSTPGTEEEKGTGLGLFLCKGFVEKHEGKIWVTSEEGAGSIFYFSIPC
jgi:PAS domain S-box-containing protein